MGRRIILAICLLFGLGVTQGHGQASPYSNSVFPAQIFTATGQTGATIQLNGLVTPSSTVGSSFASGTITFTGTSLTTVSFSLLGSADNGVTFFALPLIPVASPSTTPNTVITATANGLYQVSLAGLTHVRFATTGTFTAVNASIILTASPNALTARGNTGGGGAAPVGTPLALAAYQNGSGTQPLTSANFFTDATFHDLSVRNLGGNLSTNSILNYDGFGSLAAINASPQCVGGCDIDIAPTSPITESPYNTLTNSGVHIAYRKNGSLAHIFNNPAMGFNSFKGGLTTQCYFSDQPTVGNQVSSCLQIADTMAAPGTYQNPWQAHVTLPISSWVVGRSISQVLSIQNFCHRVGDCGSFYSYLHPRAGIFAGSDEAVVHQSLETFEDPPMFGTLITGGASATIIKGNWTTNGNNESDGLDVDSLDPSDQGAAGLLLTEVLDTATGTFEYTTSDAHAVSTAFGKLVTGCGASGLSRNAPQNTQCLVTNITSLPSAWAVGPQSVCFADPAHTEQVFLSAIGTGAAFQANHSYSVGDEFFDGTNFEEVTVNGTSAATAPTWPTTLSGEVTDAGGVSYQMVALGSNSQMLTMGVTYPHNQGVAIGQGGMCGYGMVQGAGNPTPTAIGVWQSIPAVFSQDAHSFNYVAPYAGNEEGVQSRGIPRFPTTSVIGQPSGFNQISRVGNTVTAVIVGDASISEFNGWVPPAGASIVVTTGDSNFDSATQFSNFAVTSIPDAINGGYDFQLTYNDNLNITDGGGGSGTIQVNGLNNYVAPCRAETVRVLGTFPQGPNSDSGLPWGDGTLQVEPNHCNWPVGGAIAQPNHFATAISGLRVTANVFTPAFVNNNVGVKLGLTGQGNSGAAFLLLNGESEDSLSAMIGHGGSNLGHIAIESSDWYKNMFVFGHSPLLGGAVISIGPRPPNDPVLVYPFVQMSSDAGGMALDFNSYTGELAYPASNSGSAPGLFGAGVLHSKVHIVDIFLAGLVPGFPTTSAFIANTFGYLSFSSAGITDPNSWKSDYTLSAGAYYGSSVYAGAGLPQTQGLFLNGSSGTSQWCYAAVAETPVGHGVSTGNQCTTTGPATLGGPNAIFVKYYQLPGTQTFRIFRTVAPAGFALGTICDLAQVADQGCFDTGQAPTDSVDPSTLTDTSGVMYAATWNQGSKTFGASGTSHGIGLVPDPGATAGTTRVLFEDGTWRVPTGAAQVYPGAGVAVSTGAAWGTSLAAPASALVGLTDVQTLTGKTVDGVTPATFAFLDATSSIQTQLGLKAPLASPTFTATPAAPTAGVSSNTTQLATTAFVKLVTGVSTQAVSSTTLGTGVTSATCASAACTVTRGTYTIVGGTGTTGTIVTLVWTATPTAYVCRVNQNAGTTSFGIGHALATTTGVAITAANSVSGQTFTVDYECVP